MLGFAQPLAYASGEVIRHYYRAGYQVEWKADESPVTVADRQAEEIMREMIAQAYPDARRPGRGIRRRPPRRPLSLGLSTPSMAPKRS